MMFHPRPRVLVLDTDPVGLLTLEILLDAMDFRVATATNCALATALIDALSPRIAVIEMRALEAAPAEVEALGERLVREAMPVVMLGGGGCCEGRNPACKVATWRRCLAKPLDAGAFAAAVEAAFARKAAGIRG